MAATNPLLINTSNTAQLGSQVNAQSTSAQLNGNKSKTADDEALSGGKTAKNTDITHTGRNNSNTQVTKDLTGDSANGHESKPFHEHLESELNGQVVENTSFIHSNTPTFAAQGQSVATDLLGGTASLSQTSEDSSQLGVTPLPSHHLSSNTSGEVMTYSEMDMGVSSKGLIAHELNQVTTEASLKIEGSLKSDGRPNLQILPTVTASDTSLSAVRSNQSDGPLDISMPMGAKAASMQNIGRINTVENKVVTDAPAENKANLNRTLLNQSGNPSSLTILSTTLSTAASAQVSNTSVDSLGLSLSSQESAVNQKHALLSSNSSAYSITPDLTEGMSVSGSLSGDRSSLSGGTLDGNTINTNSINSTVIASTISPQINGGQPNDLSPQGLLVGDLANPASVSNVANNQLGERNTEMTSSSGNLSQQLIGTEESTINSVLSPNASGSISSSGSNNSGINSSVLNNGATNTSSLNSNSLAMSMENGATNNTTAGLSQSQTNFQGDSASLTTSTKTDFSDVLDTLGDPSVDETQEESVRPTLNRITATPTGLSNISYRMVDGQPVATSFMPTTFGQAGWSEQVASQVAWFSSKNVREAEIQLDPPELGSLQVRVTMSQEQASVSFSSPHASVREALDQSVVRLREMFNEQNIDLVDVDVSGQSHDESFAQESQTNQEGEPQLVGNDNTEVADTPDNVSMVSVPVQDGLVREVV